LFLGLRRTGNAERICARGSFVAPLIGAGLSATAAVAWPSASSFWTAIGYSAIVAALALLALVSTGLFSPPSTDR